MSVTAPARPAIATQAQEAELKSTIAALVELGTRHTASDTRSETRGIGTARRWAESRFAAISKDCGGSLTIIKPSDIFTASRLPTGTLVEDVVSIKLGATDHNRVIVITGHIDSINSVILNSSDDAPGTNDDASGVSVVLEAAHILSKISFPETLVLSIGYGEEQSLYGGRVIAAYAYAQGYGDMLSFVDFPYLAQVSRLNIASMAALAMAPAPPREVTLKAAANTTISWTLPPAPGVAIGFGGGTLRSRNGNSVAMARPDRPRSPNPDSVSTTHSLACRPWPSTDRNVRWNSRARAVPFSRQRRSSRRRRRPMRSRARCLVADRQVAPVDHPAQSLIGFAEFFKGYTALSEPGDLVGARRAVLGADSQGLGHPAGAGVRGSQGQALKPAHIHRADDGAQRLPVRGESGEIDLFQKSAQLTLGMRIAGQIRFKMVEARSTTRLRHNGRHSVCSQRAARLTAGIGNHRPEALLQSCQIIELDEGGAGLADLPHLGVGGTTRVHQIDLPGGG